MAQQVKVVLLDDLDGTEATESHDFALNGVEYEIDLSEENSLRFKAAFEEFTAVARRKTGSRNGQVRQRRSAHGAPSVRHSREYLQSVRGWARKKGYTVLDRGRVPKDILDKFEEAHRRP